MIRRLLAVLALPLLLAACVHPKPKPPVPPPTPPPSTTMPAPGVPVRPDMLLRQAGGQLTNGVQLFGAIPCCMEWFKDGVSTNTLWPMASEEWQDWTHSFGANAWHFRFGPFIQQGFEPDWEGIGGPYNLGVLDWNPKFWQKAREMAWHAVQLKGWVEVNPVDTWACKYAQAGNPYSPWPDSEIQACGRTPSPEVERYVRKVVSEMGCFGNVIWLLDNEGGNIRGTTAQWYLWEQSVIRDEEKKSGCNFVHMVGTNSGIAEVESQVDYVAYHDRAPLGPSAGWTENNEHNPTLGPEAEAAAFKGARDIGKAWWYWRAELSDEDQVKTLGLFRDVVAGGQTGCFAPEPDAPGWVAAAQPYNPAPVLGWLEAAKAEVGDPKALPGATVWDRGLLALDKLGASLRKAGHCSSDRWRDALAVQGPDGKWYEIHAVAFTDGGWSGQAYKGNVWDYKP